MRWIFGLLEETQCTRVDETNSEKGTIETEIGLCKLFIEQTPMCSWFRCAIHCLFIFFRSTLEKVVSDQHKINPTITARNADIYLFRLMSNVSIQFWKFSIRSNSNRDEWCRNVFNAYQFIHSNNAQCVIYIRTVNIHWSKGTHIEIRHLNIW